MFRGGSRQVDQAARRPPDAGSKQSDDPASQKRLLRLRIRSVLGEVQRPAPHHPQRPAVLARRVGPQPQAAVPEQLRLTAQCSDSRLGARANWRCRWVELPARAAVESALKNSL